MQASLKITSICEPLPMHIASRQGSGSRAVSVRESFLQQLEQHSSDCAYDSGGDRPALVLLHGLTGTWHIWQPLIPYLERHHRVVALTLPGHYRGLEMPAGVPSSVDGIVSVLSAELERRGISQPHVAGNSLGGWVALEMARQGRVASVTALSPGGGWKTREDYRRVVGPFRIMYRLTAVMVFIFSLLVRFSPVRRLLQAKIMEHGERMAPVEVLRAMRALGHTRILLPLLDTMESYGPIRPMAASPIPIRIAWSELDRILPYKPFGETVCNAVPGADLVHLRGCGHVPMYDNPELVANVILRTTCPAESKQEQCTS